MGVIMNLKLFNGKFGKLISNNNDLFILLLLKINIKINLILQIYYLSIQILIQNYLTAFFIFLCD